MGQWTLPGNLVRLNGFRNPDISYLRMVKCFTYCQPDSWPETHDHIKNMAIGHTAQNADFSMLMKYLDGP